MNYKNTTDPALREQLEAEAEAERALLKQQEALERERQRQEDLLVKDALRLLRQDKIKLDDISETFIFRKLLTGAFSSSATERQWAVTQLMGLKGMKASKKGSSKSEGPDVGSQLLDRLTSAV
tara:strand:- start:775 stop:1143 length:369 start_codon:yes stop_codon:yes gene_type:complete